jgi:hypothetical protein
VDHVSDCLCEVQNINPNQITLDNVATGGKRSSITRKVVVIVQAVDAPGVSCDAGEFSEPTKISLKMVDDGGHILIDNGKTVQCKGGLDNDGSPEQINIRRSVPFQGPLNCENSEVPPDTGPSSNTVGIITSTAMGSPGTTPYVTDTKIKCFR